MRETRHRKTTLLSAEANRFERGKGNSRKHRLHDPDFGFSCGQPGKDILSFEEISILHFSVFQR